jgi:hypothetical protein
MGRNAELPPLATGGGFRSTCKGGLVVEGSRRGNHSDPLRARPTVYKGIEMRSRLEAEWAASFDEMGWPWEYEPCAYADERGRYLPDFRLREDDGRVTFIEVKGWLGDPVPVMEQMEICLSSEPTATLMLRVGSDLIGDWEGSIYEVDGERWIIWFDQADLHSGYIGVFRAVPLDGQAPLPLPLHMKYPRPYSFIQPAA